MGETLFLREVKRVVDVDDVATEVLVCHFASQVFILITQANKVGNIIKAWSEPKVDGGARFITENLLGRRDDPLLDLYARQLIERLQPLSANPLLLSICLIPEGRNSSHFQEIINVTMDMVVEALG